jgi:hypothetical protein
MSFAILIVRIIFLLAGLFITNLAVQAIISGQISSRGLTWTYEDQTIKFCIAVLVRLLPGLWIIYVSISKFKPKKISTDEQKLK